MIPDKLQLHLASAPMPTNLFRAITNQIASLVSMTVHSESYIKLASMSKETAKLVLDMQRQSREYQWVSHNACRHKHVHMLSWSFQNRLQCTLLSRLQYSRVAKLKTHIDSAAVQRASDSAALKLHRLYVSLGQT